MLRQGREGLVLPESTSKCLTRQKWAIPFLSTFKTSLVALGGAAFRAKCGKSEDEENKQWSHFKEATKLTQRLKHEETIPFPVLTSLEIFELFSPVLMP